MRRVIGIELIQPLIEKSISQSKDLDKNAVTFKVSSLQILSQNTVQYISSFVVVFFVWSGLAKYNVGPLTSFLINTYARKLKEVANKAVQQVAKDDAMEILSTPESVVTNYIVQFTSTIMLC